MHLETPALSPSTSTPSPSSKRGRIDVDLSAEQHVEHQPKEPEKKETPTKTTNISLDQMCGKHCIVCSTYRSPSSVPLPMIHIGKFRTLMICKKQHLTNREETVIIQQAIDQETAFIRGNGDIAIDEIMEGMFALFPLSFAFS